MNNECTPEEKETIKEMIGWLTKILEGKQIRWVNHETTLNSIVKANARWYAQQKFEVVEEPKMRPLTEDEWFMKVKERATLTIKNADGIYVVYGVGENKVFLLQPNGLVIHHHSPYYLLKYGKFINGSPCGVEVTE